MKKKKRQMFENFESVLYLESGSMPFFVATGFDLSIFRNPQSLHVFQTIVNGALFERRFATPSGYLVPIAVSVGVSTTKFSFLLITNLFTSLCVSIHCTTST